MPFIVVDDKIYTFVDNALARMREREITEQAIEFIMSEPEQVEISFVTGRDLYMGQPPEKNQRLAVVVDEARLLIISVYWID